MAKNGLSGLWSVSDNFVALILWRYSVRNFFVGLVIVLVGASAHAQFSPKLAYSKTGKGQVASIVYLANSDNTTSVAIYNSSRPIQVLAAKSGQLAIGTSDGLRLVNYSISGNSVSASSPIVIETGTTYGAAYSPDGSQLAYSVVTGSSSAAVRIRDLASNSYSDVVSTANIDSIAFVGSKVLYSSYLVGGGMSIRAYNTADSSDVELLNTNSQEMGGVNTMSAAHLSNAVVFDGGCKTSAAASCGSGINLYSLDLDSLVVERLTIGMLDQSPVLDSSDSKVTYTEMASSKNSSAVYLMRKDRVTGVITRLSAKTDTFKNLCAIP